MRLKPWKLLLTIFLVLTMVACQGGTDLTGNVSSSNGQNLENVDIELSVLGRNGHISKTWISKTDKSGNFLLQAYPHAPLFPIILIKVTKADYKPYVTSMRSRKHLIGKFVLCEYGDNSESTGVIQEKE